jgi:hypothetical protein
LFIYSLLIDTFWAKTPVGSVFSRCIFVQRFHKNVYYILTHKNVYYILRYKRYSIVRVAILLQDKKAGAHTFFALIVVLIILTILTTAFLADGTLTNKDAAKTHNDSTDTTKIQPDDTEEIEIPADGTDTPDEQITTQKMQYVEGDRIFDGNQSEVMWRGAGGSYLFHAGDHYQEAWLSHLPEIQAMKLNTIRLAFAFTDSNYNPEYGAPSSDILDFAKMDWVLDFLDENGIKGILDLHNWYDMFGDFGSEKLINNWRSVAAHYRGDPRVAAYELFNEPSTATWASSISSKMDAASFYANLTDAIREVDPEHIVIWESQPFIPPFEDVAGLLRPNMVFTFHRWWNSVNDEFNIWTPELLSYTSLSYAVEYRKKLNVPFWLGEFGSENPFNSSNTEWLVAEQHLCRCEEQAVGWNLWMGRTSINKIWNGYLPFFPLRCYNQNLTRQSWQPPNPSFTGYVLAWNGADRLEPYRIELWHKNSYVELKPGIVVRVIVNRRLSDGTFQITSDQELVLTERTTIKNFEGTAQYPDYNTKIYAVGYA